MRFRPGRGMWLAVVAAAVGLLTFSTTVWAYSNGPKNSDNLQDGGGTSHSSTVYYNRQLSPFIAWVDRMYYGGRNFDTSDNPIVCCAQWRRDYTKYKEWNGSKWVTVKTVWASGWRTSGTPGQLSYWDLNTDATLDGGALVQQMLKWKYLVPLPQPKWLQWKGVIHSHYLE